MTFVNTALLTQQQAACQLLTANYHHYINILLYTAGKFRENIMSLH